MKSLNFRKDSKTQTIEELWKSLEFFVRRRVEDNNCEPHNYPLNTRIEQMNTLKTLVNTIDETHNSMMMEILEGLNG